jgi:hypothetical protein
MNNVRLLPTPSKSLPFIKSSLLQVARHFREYRIDAYDADKNALTKRMDADEEFLRQYAVARQTIYVCGLPIDVDLEELNDFCSEVGQIRESKIIRPIGG